MTTPAICISHLRKVYRGGTVAVEDVSLTIQPGSLVYRDISVRVHLHLEYPRNRGFTFWRSNWDYRNILVRLIGPGRVAVNSIFERPEGMEAIRNHSYATRRRW